MIREWIIHDSHLRLGFRHIRLGNDLGHLLPINLADIIQIIDIIVEVEAIIDRVTGSIMEWVVL